METIDAVSKIAEIASRGTGALWAPKQIKRMAKADVFAKEKMAECLKNIGVPTMHIDERTIMLSPEMKELIENAEKRRMTQAIWEEQNLNNVVKHTYDVLGDTVVPDQRPSDDWSIKFFKNAQDVSIEELQIMWGKILAGEIKKPKSFSIRTLDVLKNLCMEDAHLFQRACELVLFLDREKIIVNDRKFLDGFGLNVLDFSKLQQYGLIDQGLLSINIPIGDKTIVHNRKHIGIFTNNSKYEENISIYLLTEAGKELFKIIDYEPNLKHLKEIVEMHKKITVDIHLINTIKDDDTVEDYHTESLKDE